ncbi:MAG: DUF4912 domain-containing protein [Candidatus Omnitrophica bacterium]|nr:DUF4912 domain-containing protein [Candidatus Omnitrophota bacterium]
MAIIRRIKERIGKIIKNKKKPTVAQKRILRKTREKAAKKEVLGTQELAIEKTKFYALQSTQVMPRKILIEELPPGYGEDKITLQVRDPWWIHAYWEITSQTWNTLSEKLKEDFFTAKRVLRVYDVSHIIFDGTNAHRFFDIEITVDSNNWYIDVGGPGRFWCVDIGLKLNNGKFIMIARSNTVHTPIEGPSWITDEEWMVPEDVFARLYGMGFGLGKSSPVGKAWQERIRKALFSGALASPGIASMASPVKIPKERKFWLVVNTELIVYGATEPDAQVYVQDRNVKLRPDGTFTLRFALPDGKQVIPVKAISADRLEERTITPIVTKETR